MSENDITKIIEAAEAAFTALFNAGDSSGLARLYTESGQIFPDDSDPVGGRDAIEQFFAELVKDHPRIRLATKEVKGFGNFAYEVGAFILLMREEVEYGNYIVIWQHRGDQWKLHRDIFNVKARTKRELPDVSLNPDFAG